MINSINSATPQMTFQAKPGNRKAIHEFIDKNCDFAKEITMSFAEKEESMRRKSLDYLKDLKIKCSYAGEIIERGKAALEHIKEKLSKNN